ncbi:MAG: Glutamyl-tRNA reductase [Chthoniobacteraceae bacterium]|nr:Glutamyl-tRNA reductase [Chthoniobacteraceae bacterium]
MQILCLGLSHHTAPIELREKFAFTEGELGAAALQLAKAPGVGEAVIVSTCNRVELYVAVEESTRGFAAIDDFIASRVGSFTSSAPVALASAFTRLPTSQSLRHLFRVVSGLESMVLGETEILGQVKKAYQAAQLGGATGRHLNKFFQRAFNVAKEVRTNTNITRGSVSVGSVAVDLAEKLFGKLAECHVMILGAGEMSELTAGALRARGVKSIFVANRSFDRAAALALSMGGKAVHFDQWQNEFHDVDILIGSTAAPHHVLTAEKLAPIMRTRRDRPLFCIDLAVPRDIEPAVNDIDGVYLYDIDRLQEIASHSMNIRRQELTICEEMIERHVVEFGDWLNGPSGESALRYQAAVSAPQGVKS